MKEKERKKYFTLKGALLVAVVVIVVAGMYYYHLPKKATITTSQKQPLQTGQQLQVPIVLDTQGYTINAAEVYLHFDPSVVRIDSVSKEPSFFQLWITDQPKFSNQTGDFSFAGGLPSPGFTGKGTIGTVTITLLHPGAAQFAFLPTTRVLLNDGKGTAVPLKLSPIMIHGK